MSILRRGASKKYSDGWAKAFGKSAKESPPSKSKSTAKKGKKAMKAARKKKTGKKK